MVSRVIIFSNIFFINPPNFIGLFFDGVGSDAVEPIRIHVAGS
jgi:hypothetical protein